ncbi:MAG: T9SS type A sorting domain-containing protein [bacterium]
MKKNIYPNPASEYIEISNFNHTVNRMVDELLDIQIYNIYGECITNLTPCPSPRERGVRINVSGYPNGIYFIRIGNEIQKFVVLK